MFTRYYFEGPGYEIFPLRTRLNDIFQNQSHPILEKDADRHGLSRIWEALQGPEDILPKGFVCSDIHPDACQQLRNGKWAMEVQVDGDSCLDLWDLMIRRWAPHCRYYYLDYGCGCESNDLKHRYFSSDYIVKAWISPYTPERLRRIFTRHTVYLQYDYKANFFYKSKPPYITRYAHWKREELRRELLRLVPHPELSMDDLVDVVYSKLMTSRMTGLFETFIHIFRIHYLEPDHHRYFIPALEELRQKGQLR